jgi:hypothetical protein
VPVNPLSEVPGKAGAPALIHIGAICVNAGGAGDVTVTFIVVPIAHWPASTEKEYVLVPGAAVLIAVGDQVPDNPSIEILFNISGVPPSQYEPSCTKLGKAGVFTIVVAVKFKTELHVSSEILDNVMVEFGGAALGTVIIEIPPVNTVV